jgi:hypothetical protein
MAEGSLPPSETVQTLSAGARFYRLHREECLARSKEKYNNNPEVIRKREERQKRKEEKEAARLAKRELTREEKRLQKEKEREEKLKVALATRRKLSTNPSGLESPG